MITSRWLIEKLLLTEPIQDSIKEYLDRMNVQYHEKENRFLIPIKIDNKSLFIIINIEKEWIDTWVQLIKAMELPSDLKKEDFYARLLRETLYMKEVAYGLTKRGDVIVHAEVHRTALSYENFHSEFGSVVFGAKHFIENIMKDYPRIKITRSPPTTMWEPG